MIRSEKWLHRILVPTILLCAAFGWSVGHAQGVFLKYAPQPGIQKSTGLDYHNTAAASTDVSLLFCSSSSTNFLRADGACAVPAGVTPSGAANLVFATPNGSSGAATLRALVGADIAPINLASTANGGVLSTSILLGTNGGTSNGFFSVTGPTTSLKTFTFPNASATILTDAAAVTVAQGGTGVATLTNHGVLIGAGTGTVGAVAAMAADTLLQGQGATSNPAAVTVNNCGSSTTALSYSTSTHTFGCQTISAGGTGTVTNVASGTGLTGGPITTTGTLSVDQTASLTWTGIETFSNSSGSSNVVVTGNVNGVVSESITNASTGGSASAGLTLGNVGSGPGAVFKFASTGAATPIFTGGPTGAAAFFGTVSGVSSPLVFGTGGVTRWTLGSTGGMTVAANATSVVALDLTQAASAPNGLAIAVRGNGGGVGVGLIDGGAGTQFFTIRVGGVSTGTFDIFDASNSVSRLSITSGGSVSLPSLAASSAATTGTVCWTSGGNLTVDTTVACLASTRKVKQNIDPIDVGLSEVMKLRPVSYELKPEFDPGHLGRQVGLIAEEVADVDPRLVAMGDDGPRGVRYMQMTAVLIKAIQEQQRQIFALELAIMSLFLWCLGITIRGRRRV